MSTEPMAEPTGKPTAPGQGPPLDREARGVVQRMALNLIGILLAALIAWFVVGR